MKTNHLFLFFLLFGPLSVLGQGHFTPSNELIRSLIGKPKKTSEERQQIGDYYVDLAYEAYAKGDVEEARKLLDESNHHSVVSPRFFTLLGQYYFDKKQYMYAKRYWSKGALKTTCPECEAKLKDHEALLRDVEPK